MAPSSSLFVLLVSLVFACATAASSPNLFTSVRQPGWRNNAKRGWAFTWPVRSSVDQGPGKAPGPRCFNHCNRVRFWKNHAFIFNSRMSDDFYKYGGKPNPNKWVVTDPFTRGKGQWFGRQPGAFIPENVWVQRHRIWHKGGLNIRAQSFIKDTRPYEKVFRRTKARSDKTLEDQGYEEFTMGMVSSKRAVQYGYFEAESRIMPTQLVNAFWMSSKVKGRFEEIDVYENSHVSDKESQFGIDMRFYSVPNAHASKDKSSVVEIGNLISAKPPWYKHWEWIQKRPVTYGLLWSPLRITWFVNGLPYVTIPNKNWNQPMFIRFDVETNMEWHGILPNVHFLRKYPQLYKIRYFRVWSIRWQRPDPKWKPAVRQSNIHDVPSTVHEITDEARISGLVSVRKLKGHDPNRKAADKIDMLTAEWMTEKTEDTDCQDYEEGDISGLQNVTDGAGLGKHPQIKGEALGVPISPPDGLTRWQSIKAFQSEKSSMTFKEYLEYLFS